MLNTVTPTSHHHPRPPVNPRSLSSGSYLQYDWAVSLQASPATALEVTTTWLNVSDIRRYGQNGVFVFSQLGL